eukprot:5191372-Prymnesium_polylepis.2
MASAGVPAALNEIGQGNTRCHVVHGTLDLCAHRSRGSLGQQLTQLAITGGRSEIDCTPSDGNDDLLPRPQGVLHRSEHHANILLELLLHGAFRPEDEQVVPTSSSLKRKLEHHVAMGIRVSDRRRHEARTAAMRCQQ